MLMKSCNEVMWRFKQDSVGLSSKWKGKFQHYVVVLCYILFMNHSSVHPGVTSEVWSSVDFSYCLYCNPCRAINTMKSILFLYN